MAVQINGQAFSAVHRDRTGHHGICRQPDLAHVIRISKVVQRIDLCVIITAVLLVDLLPDHSFRLLPPRTQKQGQA